MEHEPRLVDGIGFERSLRPADADSLARTLAALSAADVSVVVTGNGSRLSLGNPPRDAALLLDVSKLAGVDDFDPGEGVCHVGAGTSLGLIRDELATEGWELPLDATGAQPTLGGVVAAAAAGPRALGYGAPRDVVLGLGVVLASGVRTRCGGRVVKNVTGYDLCKVYTGSLGSLGVIESAWLRLRPRPQAVRSLELVGEGIVEGVPAALAAARSPASRAVALELAAPRSGEAFRLVVEFAGDASVVDREAERLGNEFGAGDAPAKAIDAVRVAQGSRPGPSGLRFRVSTLASHLGAVAMCLRAAGAGIQAQPGRSVVYAFFDGVDPAAAFEAAAEAARVGEGAALLEHGPPTAKRDRDVFGPPGSEFAIALALKQRFDPQGILNPGRFAGRL
jgi:glycolate oxidase FAD binding subunit